MEITKGRYLYIRETPTEDVIPVLHAYNNYACQKGKEMTIEEFRKYYTEWIMHPVVAMNMSRIISGTFRLMDKIFEV